MERNVLGVMVPAKVSSLANHAHERSATTSDLVLDLVFVIVLSRLGYVLRDTIEDVDNNAAKALYAFFSLFNPLVS